MYSQDTLHLPRDEPIEKPHYTPTKHPGSSKDGAKKAKTPFVSLHRSSRKSEHKAPKPSVSALHYCESMDYLISGYEDNRICIWGYNEESEEMIAGSIDAEAQSGEHVSNRVSGLALKATFMDHKDVVTSLASITEGENCWLLSSGWDKRICLWDLKSERLLSIFSNSNSGYGREELAADGIIHALEYCAERREFGYASADKQAYIRKFSTRGNEMTLVAVLQGHEADVTQVHKQM